MDNSVKTILENNLRNAQANNDQNSEDFGFSVLIQFIKNYLKSRKGLLPQFESLLTDLDFVRNFEVKNITESNIFEKIDFTTISFDDFCVSCNFLLNKIIELPIYQNSYTLEHLNEMIVGLLQPRPNQIIYDPVCGIGSTFVTLHKKFPNYNFTFAGQEVNPAIQFLCKLNLTLEWIGNGDIYWSNSLSHPILAGKGKVDIAIAILPLGTMLNRESLSIDIFENPQDIPNTEYAFIELILAMLNENGKAVIIVPDSFLSVVNGKEYRKKYIEQGIIEYIISLPNEFFVHSSIKSSIIILNKHKDKQLTEVIQFIKYTKEYLGSIQLIHNSQLIDFDLTVNKYAHEDRQEFSKILQNTAKENIFTINDTIKQCVRGKAYTKDLVYSKLPDAIPYVGVSDLSRNIDNFTLNIAKIERKIAPDKAQKLVNFSAILVSLIGTYLKPTYFKYEGQPIITSSDIIALQFKEHISSEFIIIQLYSRLVEIQTQMVVSGTTIPRINTSNFLNIKLIIPNIEQQQRQVVEFLLGEKEKAKIEITEAKEEIKTTEYDVIATIAHNLNQKLGSIRDDYDGLISFLHRMEREKKLLNFKETLRPLHIGEDIYSVDTLEKITKRISEILLDTSQTLKTTEDILQKDTLDLQEIDFVEFLKTEKNKYTNENFVIEIRTKLKSSLISIDSNAIKDTLRNLILNAKKHGFIQNELRYIFIFELTKISTDDGEYLRLVCKNNGKPFPKGFTFAEYTRLGGRSGKNKGTGIGGFFIKKVIDLHNGKFNYISIENPLEIYQVQFEILLPLS